jgi:hypothetical protein
MANRSTKLVLQVVLTMDDINAQTCERLRAASLLPLGLVCSGSSSDTAGGTAVTVLRAGSIHAAGSATVAALGGAGSINTAGSTALRGADSSSSITYTHYLSRKSRELIYEVFGTKVAVKLFVRPAGWPRTLYEDGRELAGYFGCCGTPDGYHAWF